MTEIMKKEIMCVWINGASQLLGVETGPYLLQVVELHRNLPEEEVDVAAPLHRVHEVGFWGEEGSEPSP